MYEIISQVLSTDWQSVYSALMTIIAAVGGVVAAIQSIGKKKETDRADAAFEEIQETQAFFDPENTDVMTPPARTPDRSWKMSESVKSFLLAGHSDDEKVSILKQVEEAEAAGYVDYTISYPGGYYKISYGQINGGGMFSK